MYAALRFGFGNSLYDGRQTQILAGYNLVTLYARDNFPITAMLAWPLVHDFNAPALASANLLYMRNKSPEKIAASSPPVPARISKNTLDLSLGSLGNKRLVIAGLKIPIGSLFRYPAPRVRVDQGRRRPIMRNFLEVVEFVDSLITENYRFSKFLGQRGKFVAIRHGLGVRQ